MKKFYKCGVRGTNNVKYFQNQQSAVDFVTKDTIEYYRIFRDVKLECFDVKRLECFDVKGHDLVGEVVVYFTKEGDDTLYVCSYIQIREFED